MESSCDQTIYNRMVEIRRDLHRHPELSWQEFRTAHRIAELLDEMGISYRSSVAGTGIVGEIPGERSRPVIALRADIDALPVQEETGLEFASGNQGVMHACGHDGHTSMVLGAAELLRKEESLPCAVRLIFQPAEELGAGASAMIREGVLEDVAMIFGAHIDRHYSTGSIVAVEGPISASADGFRLQISSSGGHGAYPHESVDAVVVGSLLVMAIQTIVSREVNPSYPSVVTVGRFDAGTACNVIAGSAVLEGTIRAQHPEVREHLVRSVRRISESVAQLHNAKVSIEFWEGTPALINSPEAAAIARQAALSVVGEENLVPMPTSSMGGEDFAYFLDHVPGCYVRLGAQVPGLENFPAHSSRFDFDENVLKIGADFFYQVAKLAGRVVAGSGPERTDLKVQS
jgi:hippurate hydrolase